ncbi:MAG: ribonuclease P protein subunit [Nanoarchaeota archaeon]|nr:ribonuclease P protein subunit [Nanoarchaeota archaeon]
MRTASNIARHELIGLEIEVVAAKNKSLVGRKGVILDETRDTLKIKEKTKEITMMKNAIVFRTQVGGNTVEIDGSCLAGRPEDRAKGKK